jgi:hypothetical protein
MEPFNDDELKRLLQSWQAPTAPRSLSRRVLRKEMPLWLRIFSTSFRVPVPVAVAAAVVIVFLLIYRKPPAPPEVRSDPTTSLAEAGFQPVRSIVPVYYSGGQNQ